ncbi:MAG: fasciclin domain-containing protein [Salinimicrobium sp.]
MTALSLFFVSFTACSNDDDGVKPPVVETNTIADFVASNPNYSSLAAALEVVGLTATLDGTTNYTVFAPDNDAFATFLDDNGFASLNEVPETLLEQVLLNHVQQGAIMSGDLTTGYIPSMAVGEASNEKLSMYINTDSGVTINGVATVETADIEVDNGVIHAVDAVIGLPSIVTFATADPNFSTLVTALTRESDYTFVETLMMTSDPAPFTVFAPTNQAFADLVAELEISGLGDLSSELLATVLSYHVVPSANVRSSDLSDGMMVTALSGDDFTVNLGDNVTLTDERGRTSTVVAADVQANNGVIHVIDTVLLPE